MTQTIQINDINLTCFNEEEVSIINSYITRFNAGEKIIFKRKTTKNGVFLNIYVYQQTSWKHYLEQSIQIKPATTSAFSQENKSDVPDEPQFLLTIITDEKSHKIPQPNENDIENAIHLLKIEGNALILDCIPYTQSFRYVQSIADSVKDNTFYTEVQVEDLYDSNISHNYGKIISEKALKKILLDFIEKRHIDIKGWEFKESYPH